jgi:hypothetical protein
MEHRAKNVISDWSLEIQKSKLKKTSNAQWQKVCGQPISQFQLFSFSDFGVGGL